MWRHHVAGLAHLYDLAVDTLPFLLVLNPLVAQLVMVALVWVRTDGIAGDAAKAAAS